MDPNSTIEPADLEKCTPKLRPGDILALDTGWSEFVGTTKYDDEHPALSVAAAEWLVAQKIKLLAVDFTTPDKDFQEIQRVLGIILQRDLEEEAKKNVD